MEVSRQLRVLRVMKRRCASLDAQENMKKKKGNKKGHCQNARAKSILKALLRHLKQGRE